MQPAVSNGSRNMDGVGPVIEQGATRLVPGQVQSADISVGVPLAQLEHGRGDDDPGGMADDDAAGCGGGGVRSGRGLGGRTQQRRGPGQEDLAVFRQPRAPRGPVEQPGTEVLAPAGGPAC